MIFRSCVVILAVVCSTSTASAGERSIPNRFAFKYGGDPIWVSVSEAITPSGLLRSDFQRPEHLKLLLSQRQHEPQPRRSVEADTAGRDDSCDVAFTSRSDGQELFTVTSLAQLTEIAEGRAVISGTVSASALGLHDGVPYTVLQIETDDWPEASDARVYLMYPRGRVRFENTMFCNRNPAFSELPAIGDGIAFVAPAPVDSTGTLFMTSGSWLLYEHEGVVISPPSLQLDPDLPRSPSIRAIADRLRAARHSNAER